jgi:hypothetical protein
MRASVVGLPQQDCGQWGSCLGSEDSMPEWDPEKERGSGLSDEWS